MEEKKQENQDLDVLSVFGKGKTIYQVAGNDVELSFDIVRNYLTKGNGKVSGQDIVQFISICKFNRLNPFLNEAYLVKYGESPAQMVVSKEAFFKRADANDQYEGIKSGVILIRDNQIVEVEGCFYNEKSDILVGGWCEVYRSDRKFPVIAKVNLSEYDKKQSTWNDKKSTMISKIAKVQALREAFPAQLGALYTQEEQNVQDAEYEEIKTEKKHISFDSTEAEKINVESEQNSTPSSPDDIFK